MSEIRLSRNSAERGVQRVAALALVAVLGLIVWQAIVGSKPDATTIGLLIGGLVAIVALYYPRGFVSLGNRIANVDAFGIKIELKVKEVQETLEEFAIEEDGASITRPDHWPTDDHQAVEMIADLLREKLRFASEAFYGDVPGISEELIIDKLGLDGVLTFKEAQLSRDLLDDLYEKLDELNETKRLKFLENAWAFAFRFASQTFDRKARRDLRGAGWKILDFEQNKGHRPDFRAEREGIAVLTAARVASPRSTVVVTGERLTKTDAPDESNLRMIVIPDHTDHLWTEIEKGPMQASGNVLVTRIGKLLENPDLVKTDPSGLKEISK